MADFGVREGGGAAITSVGVQSDVASTGIESWFSFLLQPNCQLAKIGHMGIRGIYQRYHCCCIRHQNIVFMSKEGKKENQ